MSEWNDLENQLAAWRPRRPLDRLRRRIFRRPGDGRDPAAVVWPWLAPTTAVLLVFLTASGRSGALETVASVNPAAWLALSPSNHDLAVIAAGDSQTRQNVPGVRRFESTTVTGIPSSVASRLQLGTNGLK